MTTPDIRDDATPGVLSPEDRAHLEELEAVVERNLRTFVRVGEALMTIREEELWRAYDVPSWTAYLEERWGWSRRHGYRLMSAAETVRQVEANVTQGHNSRDGTSQLPSPSSERQVRALRRLPEEERPDAWREAVEEALELAEEDAERERIQERGPTAATVERIVDERLGAEEEDQDGPSQAPEPTPDRTETSEASGPGKSSRRPGHAQGRDRPGRRGGPSSSTSPSAPARSSGPDNPAAEEDAGEDPDRDPRLDLLNEADRLLARAARHTDPEEEPEVREELEGLADQVNALQRKIAGTGDAWRVP